MEKHVLQRFRLDGKKAVVTGGAGTIGYYTALAFAQAGADVAVVDLPRCMERSMTVAAELRKDYGIQTEAYGCNLTDERAVEELFGRIAEEFGTVDVVHNNAGIGGALAPDVDIFDEEHQMPHYDHWKHVIEVNLFSEYLVAVSAARIMIRDGHGGSIINTASMAGHIANQAPIGKTLDDSSYGVAKAGVLYFTKHFASQVISYGIRVNSISPGYCISNLHEGMDPALLEAYRKTQPIMRTCQAEELQGAVLYLASDASSYTVGADLLIDGGHLIW